MVIATSDSCNTLVTLESDHKVESSYDRKIGCGSVEHYVRTDIYLPADDFGDDQAEEPIYFPRDGRVDEYLKHLPRVVESCDELLVNEPVVYSAGSNETILYVGQGELAHALPQQCDVIVSDKATTCHILALRSTSSNGLPLASLAHIDGSDYEECIRSMIGEHAVHHNLESNEDAWFLDSKASMDVHILGGFEDCQSKSVEISNWLMRLLSEIASEYKDSMRLTLKTCAISSLNENGYSCPVGRGLALDLRTGEAFLAKVDDKLAGPVTDLRSVRLWSGPKELSVIHTAASDDIVINAFNFESLPEAELLLGLPDHVLIQHTSTSPDVEEAGFCDSVRSTLRFLRDVSCSQVFGSCSKQPLVFRRVGASNVWKRLA